MGYKSREKWERRIRRAVADSTTVAPKKPNSGLFVGIIGLAAAIFIPILQANGVDVNWQVSALAYFVLTAVCVWSLLKHGVPHRGRTAQLVAVLVLVMALGRLGLYATDKEYRRELARLGPTLPPPARTDYMESRGTSDPINGASFRNGKLVRGMASSDVIADGNLLRGYAPNYRLIAACFHFIGSNDYKDATGISKSGVFDIREGLVSMRIAWNEQFIHEIPTSKGTTYVLLLVPKNMKPSDFDSEREAINKGAFELQASSGPP